VECEKCLGESSADTKEEAAAVFSFLPRAHLILPDQHYLALLLSAVSMIPKNGKPIQSITSIRLRKKGRLPGLVGLTTCSIGEYRGERNEIPPTCRHTITFYSDLLNRLSDDAVIGVIAHELAHAWLNEHVGPEASRQREKDADYLAEMWGFDQQLSALNNETEPAD